MAEQRREALKIIGAVGSTCAFPFSADELYGQHAHGADAAPAAVPAHPRFFSAAEFETVSRLADLIIPATSTPGALAAGVPAYIDFTATNNAQSGKLLREGIAWLDRAASKQGKARFVDLEESAQVALLDPLCKAADKAPAFTGPRGGGLKARPAWKAPIEVRFFRAVKSLAADGFFTSKHGLVDTLRYSGNTVRGEFPECIHEH
ncbi:MAG: gluconate 2-dehydrogenase subunit 3 family protein [Acidobacteria bacterium]|nr:gluconate 2-dehydrogenase subunit 3 family protein [Acidobacteriota bacterium]